MLLGRETDPSLRCTSMLLGRETDPSLRYTSMLLGHETDPSLRYTSMLLGRETDPSLRYTSMLLGRETDPSLKFTSMLLDVKQQPTATSSPNTTYLDTANERRVYTNPEANLTNEKSEDKDAREPVEERHKQVLEVVGGLRVVADGGGRLRCQVETTDVPAGGQNTNCYRKGQGFGCLSASKPSALELCMKKIR